jgi:hypothetical protein
MIKKIKISAAVISITTIGSSFAVDGGLLLEGNPYQSLHGSNTNENNNQQAARFSDGAVKEGFTEDAVREAVLDYLTRGELNDLRAAPQETIEDDDSQNAGSEENVENNIKSSASAEEISEDGYWKNFIKNAAGFVEEKLYDYLSKKRKSAEEVQEYELESDLDEYGLESELDNVPLDVERFSDEALLELGTPGNKNTQSENGDILRRYSKKDPDSIGGLAEQLLNSGIINPNLFPDEDNPEDLTEEDSGDLSGT